MTKSAKPVTRAPKARLRVGKITVRELSPRKKTAVKGGVLNQVLHRTVTCRYPC
jgi:hypothetical protein